MTIPNPSLVILQANATTCDQVPGTVLLRILFNTLGLTLDDAGMR